MEHKNVEFLKWSNLGHLVRLLTNGYSIIRKVGDEEIKISRNEFNLQINCYSWERQIARGEKKALETQFGACQMTRGHELIQILVLRGNREM